MASINCLKYRGVFDYPNNQSANLLDGDAPDTSHHVVNFMGWVGKGTSTQFSGKASTLSILDQKAAWMSLWLRKGRYARREQ